MSDYYQQLFTAAIKAGQTARLDVLRDPGAKGGKKAWGEFKATIPSDQVNRQIDWSSKAKGFYSLIQPMVDGSENHHFFEQCGRIISRNPQGTVDRFAQIGFNVGQFLVANSHNSKAYSQEILQLFVSLQLQKWSTYIV